MKTNSVIAVGRQFGSGGRLIAKALAEKLEIDFYDKELITLAAKESGINPEVFAEVDERAANSLLYSLSMGIYNTSNYSPMKEMPVNDQLYLLQHKIIKNLATKPCVIVGRCADYVLRYNQNLVSIFIYADLDYRVQYAISNHSLPADKAASIVQKTDKNRANYYKFYTDRNWGNMANYDLCFKAGIMPNEQAVDFLADYIHYKEKK